MDQEWTAELKGQIQRVTYSDDETGYTVAKVEVPGYPDPVTIVGKLVSPTPGEVLRMKGIWSEHPKFGRQFKIMSYENLVPSSREGIRRYLGSGLIKGIGPVMASRIVKKFGERSLDVIQGDMEKLLLVEGIGPKRVEMIKRSWEEQKDIRNVMIFLQEYGVGAGYAARIFKQYGEHTIGVLKSNPYRLATDVFGIGFHTADKIAGRMGFDKNTPMRAQAGILYVLRQVSDEGHVFYPYEDLMRKCEDILEVEKEILVNAIDSVAAAGRIVIEDLARGPDSSESARRAVYLKPLHQCETGVASHLFRILSSPRRLRPIAADKAVDWVQGRVHLKLAARQVEAVKRAVSDKVMVITGGPGTGKTTIIKAIIKIYSRLGARLLLAAPTGRASKRMSEATGHYAKTIHRLLEYSIQRGGFQRNQDRPLNMDVLILDEVSMIDITLMYHLLKAIPSEAVLIMVGDVYQLPSVGAGSLLKDVIGSGVVPVVELNEIFRQAQESRIVVNAHKINSGIVPLADSPPKDRLEDFYFIEQDDAEKCLSLIIDLISERIPKRFGFDPFNDIQVLSPMHKGIVGTENLNIRLQEVLNPGQYELSKGERRFRLKDKVMQIKNNYEKEVFNGDIGRITGIDQEKREVIVTFDDVSVSYDYSDLDEIVPAYAISVHKSQGSEYPAVVIPLLPQHYLLLQRNLIYTAVTRGKELVILVGSKKALVMGVKNDRIMKRHTYLRERLSNESHRAGAYPLNGTPSA